MLCLQSSLPIVCHINAMSSYQKPRKGFLRMDPDCAVCRAPAAVQCACERKGLDTAVRLAEERMMTSIYNDIRNWVRAHAQDYILEYFRLLTERRKAAHAAYMDRLTQHSFMYYDTPPHPQQVIDANATLKRGIDEDWVHSVQRYPEVLEYFYSLIELKYPDENEPAVRDPPLSAFHGPRKTSRRSVGPPPTVGSARSVHDNREPLPRRTPPPIEQRRTPGPKDRRRYSHAPPPPSAAYYIAPY